MTQFCQVTVFYPRKGPRIFVGPYPHVAKIRDEAFRDGKAVSAITPWPEEEPVKNDIFAPLYAAYEEAKEERKQQQRERLEILNEWLLQAPELASLISRISQLPQS